MGKASEKQQYQADLLDWRRKHFAELENNMKILTALRDKENVAPKERIEAAKAIARHLSGLQSDRPASKFAGGTSDTGPEKTFTLPEEEKKALDALIAQTHEPIN